MLLKYFVALLLLAFCCNELHANSLSKPHFIHRKQREHLTRLHRVRRQFDLKLSAEHDDKEDDTELALEAIANLWRSQDGNTQIEGSAKIVHRSNSLQEGNTRYSATLHLRHDYKRKK